MLAINACAPVDFANGHFANMPVLRAAPLVRHYRPCDLASERRFRSSIKEFGIRSAPRPRVFSSRISSETVSWGAPAAIRRFDWSLRPEGGINERSFVEPSFTVDHGRCADDAFTFQRTVQ
jgi:hypothetical protein